MKNSLRSSLVVLGPAAFRGLPLLAPVLALDAAATGGVWLRNAVVTTLP